MNKSRFKRFERLGYHRYADWRTTILKPIAWLLSLIHVTPNIVSLLGVLAMVGYVLVLPHSQWGAVGLIAFSLFLDNIDGVLARFTRTDSDRGKFIDMICDHLNFSILIAGLVYSGLIHGLIGCAAIYGMATSKLFRSVLHAREFNSDWYFRAVAGFFPNLIVGISYLALLFYVLNKNAYLDLVFSILAGLLILDSIRYFHKLIRKKIGG